MEKLNLSTKFRAEGTKIEDMKDVLAIMEESTKYSVVSPEDVDVYSMHTVKGEKVVFFELSKTVLDAGLVDFAKKLRSVNTEAEEIDKVLLAESVAAGTLISIPVNGERKVLYTCDEAIRAIAEKAGITGKRISVPSVYRDLYIAEALYAKSSDITLVTREVEEDGMTKRKIFGALSGKYTPVSLDVIPDVITAFEKDGTLGKGVLTKWATTHFFTEALVEYPDAAEEFRVSYGLPETVVPGIRVSTSCTGDAAWRIELTYRAEKAHGVSIKKEVRRNHIGEIKPSEIIAAAKKELFLEVTELPKRLSEKMTQFIYNGDVATEAGREKNKKKVAAAIRRGIRKLHITSAIGQKRAKQIEAELTAEIMDTEIYTEFDLAVTFMSIADRIANLPEDCKRKLEKAVCDAPFVTFSPENEEEVLIMPEEV